MKLIPKIREQRKRNGLTQEQLAELTGIKPPHISKYENGKILPSIESLRKIAYTLNCLVDELYEAE